MNNAYLSSKDTDQSNETVVKRLNGNRFSDWYREREFTQNIRNGTPFFNGPRPVQSPTRHSPSKLLQCHRKIFYRELNAPAEDPEPEGIFWVGTRFEEDIALPFLQQAVTDADTYVSNSLWVDFSVETEAGELRIKGETDPVIVDSDGQPLLLTEIKTKQSVDDIDAPNRHHKAQAHAYMKGLSEKYDHDITEAVLLYASRTSLNIECFPIQFDPDFWSHTVLKWAEQQTKYRIDTCEQRESKPRIFTSTDERTFIRGGLVVTHRFLKLLGYHHTAPLSPTFFISKIPSSASFCSRS